MPVEFALRPRIRLREDPATARRARPRLPKFALPALAYWLVIGGLVYAFVRQHDASAPPPEGEATFAALTPSPLPAVREWWRPLPAPAANPPSPPLAELPAPQPELPDVPLSESAPLSDLTPLPEPAPAEPAPAEPAPAEPAPAEPAPANPSFAKARHAARALGPLPAPRPDLGSGPTLASDQVDSPAPMEVPALTLPVPAPSAPAEPSRPVAGSLPSCEAALASASQDIDFSGGNRAADLPTQAIAAVLENGAWLNSCAIPEHTAIEVCVAIKGGRVVGASVTSRPADSALTSCVRRRASSLQFPYSPHLDLARTRF